MSLLNRTQRQTLVDLLLRLPNMNDMASRNLLIIDLPRGLLNTIAFSNVPATHIANIVDALDSDIWGPTLDGKVPLLLVIENAINTVQGSRLATQLQSLHDEIQVAPPSSDSATVPSVPTPPPAPPASPTISLTNLTGPQRKQLHNALLSAFPTMADLQQMVAFGLDGALTRMAGGNLSDMTLSLMTWAQAQGRMEDLVKAALAENPTNLDLRAFAKAAGLLP